MRIFKTSALLFCLAIVVVSTLHSCRAYKDVEFKGVKEYRFTSFDTQGITCEFFIDLYNPNLYNITLMESEVDLFMEGTRLGRVKLPDAAVLANESLTTLKVSCTAEPSSIPKLLGGAIGLVFKKDIVIQGKGSVTAKAFLISKTIPVTFEQRIKKEDLGF